MNMAELFHLPAIIILLVVCCSLAPTVVGLKSAKAHMDFGCPERSYRFKDYCYTVLGSLATTYNDASDICASMGGKIASPTDKLTYHFMKKLVIRFLTTGFWLGIRKDGANWIYKGDRSKPVVDYHQWDTTEPSGDGKCAIMNLRRSLIYMSLACDLNQFYICQYETGKCSSPMVSFQGKCYNISQERLDLVAAHDVCRKSGGILVEIKSDEEFDFIKKAIYSDVSWQKWQSSFTNSPPPRYQSPLYQTWIGVRRNGTDNWVLDDGSRIDFGDWATGQPDNAGGNENCAVFSWAGLADISCREESRVMCSTKAVSAQISINV